MKKLRILFTGIALLCGTMVRADEPHTTVTELQKNEKWWGGNIGMALKMPFISDTQETFNTIESDRTLSAPFLVSSTGRYIWSEYPFSFELNDGKLTVQSRFENVNTAVGGRTLREACLIALHRVSPPSGTTPALELFTRPQYSTRLELGLNQNQEGILEYAAQIKQHDFPEGTLIIDDGWQSSQGDWKFRPGQFSNPEQMIEELHAEGFKVMLWVSPFVSPDSPKYWELADKGFLLQDKRRNKPVILEWRDGYSACYDLTNEEAYNSLLTDLKQLQEQYGFDGYKFYGGKSALYDEDYITSSNETEALSVDYTAAWAKLGTEFPFNETHASWKMGGQPLVQYLSDKLTIEEELASIVPEAVAAGLMGYAYISPGMIGGERLKKEEEPAPSLIVRLAQVQAMMPIMQFAGAPWKMVTGEQLEYCRQAALLHVKIGGYIAQLAQESAQNGAPIIRHMEYEFPKKGFADCTTQFMVGTKYLVAPILDGSDKRTVRLPNGQWKDDKGRIFKGPLVMEITVEEGRLPYYEHIVK